MFNYEITSRADYAAFTNNLPDTQKLTFNNVEEIINIDSLPPNIQFLEINNSLNVRFHGTRSEYPTIEMMIFTGSSLLGMPDISIIQPEHVNLVCTRTEDQAHAVILKEDLVIPYELQMLYLTNYTLNTDSLGNISSVRNIHFRSMSGMFVIPLSIETIWFVRCNPITFSNQFPIQLYSIILNECIITPAFSDQICNLDVRRRRSNLPRLQIKVQGLLSPSVFCPDNFYRDMHNDMANIALLRNQLPDAYRHVQSFISGGTRKKKRGLKLKRKRGSRYNRKQKRATKSKSKSKRKSKSKSKRKRKTSKA